MVASLLGFRAPRVSPVVSSWMAKMIFNASGILSDLIPIQVSQAKTHFLAYLSLGCSPLGTKVVVSLDRALSERRELDTQSQKNGTPSEAWKIGRSIICLFNDVVWESITQEHGLGGCMSWSVTARNTLATMLPWYKVILSWSKGIKYRASSQIRPLSSLKSVRMRCYCGPIVTVTSFNICIMSAFGTDQQATRGVY